jgi:hypothetical protein
MKITLFAEESNTWNDSSLFEIYSEYSEFGDGRIHKRIEGFFSKIKITQNHDISTFNSNGST